MTSSNDLAELPERAQILRAARADAVLSVLVDTFPHAPSPQTLAAWPRAVRAGLADTAGFAAWLGDAVRLEACDSPARDLLLSYLLSARPAPGAAAPGWDAVAWVGPFVRRLDQRAGGGDPFAPCVVGRDEALGMLDEALRTVRMIAALRPVPGGGGCLDDTLRTAIAALISPVASTSPAAAEAALMAVAEHAVRVLHQARGAAPAIDASGEARIDEVLTCLPGMAAERARFSALLDELDTLRQIAATVLAWRGEPEDAQRVVTAARATLLRALDCGRIPAPARASRAGA